MRLLLAIIAVSTLACGSESFSQKLAGRLRACDLVGRGRISDQLLPEPTTAAQRCFNQCILDADCGTLNALICGDPALLQECERSCEPRFLCDDGTNLRIGQRCDGEANCTDETDEAGCTDFLCGDGTVLPETFRCDYDRDCEDGSDEVGCPDGFLCDGGRHFPDSFRCNGDPDCMDGTDEAGCPQFICDDGGVVPGAWRCDLFDDCEDASDEDGCAEALAVCLMR